MDSILVLTDFSKGSTRAAEWALTLAKKGHQNLVIFHSYLGVPVIPYDTYGGGYMEPQAMVKFDEECRKELSAFAQRLEPKAQPDTSSAFRPAIQTQLGEGDLGSNVQNLVAKGGIRLVVAGASEKSFLGHLLMGNKIGQVIEKSTKPILIVPTQSIPVPVKKVMFAVSLDDIEILACQDLGELAKLFDFEIELVHVMTAGENYDASVKQAWLEKLESVQTRPVTYHTLSGDDVMSRLYKQCKKDGCDLLAMTHHQHGLIQRLFHKSTTREALDDPKLPLLIFPVNPL